MIELRLGEDAAVRCAALRATGSASCCNCGAGHTAHGLCRMAPCSGAVAGQLSARPAALTPVAARPGFDKRMAPWQYSTPGNEPSRWGMPTHMHAEVPRVTAAPSSTADLACVALVPVPPPLQTFRSRHPKEMRQLICHCDEFERPQQPDGVPLTATPALAALAQQ